MAGSGWDNQLVSLIVLIESSTGFSGLFGYNPVPGPGNLVLSISANAGTDPYGNAYPAGVTVGSNTEPQVQLVAGNPAFINFPLNNASYHSPQILADTTVDSALNPFAQLVIGGPIAALANHNDQVAFYLNSANLNGTSPANMAFLYQDISGGEHTWQFIDWSGVNINVCNELIATQPGTGTSPTNLAVPETWHALLPLPSGITAGGARYKLLAESNCILLDISLTWTAAAGNTYSLASLPAAYSVSTIAGASRIYTMQGNVNIPTAGLNCRLFVSGTSLQVIAPTSTAGGTATWTGILPLN